MRQSDLALMIGNPAAYLAAFLVLFEPAYQAYMGLFTASLAIVQLALARLMWRHGAAPGRDERSIAIAVGVALSLTTLAVPIQLSGFHIAIAWAIEGACLAWLSTRYARVTLSTAACIVVVLAMVRLLGIDARLDDPDLQLAALANLRFAAFAVLAASLFAAASWLRERPPAISASVLGHLVALLGLELELIGWVDRSTAAADRFGSVTVAASIGMALYAVMLIALGVVRRRAPARILGLAMMGIVVVKLYASDVWSVGRAFQVAAFLGLGFLLLLVSYLYSRYRSLIERLWKDG